MITPIIKETRKHIYFIVKIINDNNKEVFALRVKQKPAGLFKTLNTSENLAELQAVLNGYVKYVK